MASMRSHSMRLLLGWLSLALAAAFAQQPQTPSVSPGELVRHAVANETKQNYSGKKYMFQDYKKNLGGSQTMLLVQTREAMAGLVIAYNDKPLTEEQRKGEL